MTTLEDIGRELDVKLRNKIEGIPGELGKLSDGGTYTVRVAGETNVDYVRLYGNENNVVEAYNISTDHRARLNVRVRYTSGKRWEVIGLDTAAATVFLGESAAGANTPVVGEYNNVILPGDQFKPGRVRPLNGTDLQYWVEEFAYGDIVLGGIFGTLAGISITAGTHAPVVISVNTTTNELTATKGTEVGLPITVTRADALAVSVPTGDFKLWAYVLKNGDIVLPSDGNRNFDLRPHFGNSAGNMTSFDVEADSGTPETIGDGDSLTLAGGAGLATSISGATVTTDYDFPALTALTSLDQTSDVFVVYDDSAGTYKKIAGEYLPGGSGVFNPTGTFWQPMAAPSSPNAADDEFADASGGVPNGWTEVDFDTTLTVTESVYGLKMTKSSVAGVSVGGIYKALAAGDFSVWTYVSLLFNGTGFGGGTGFRAGLALFEDATSSTGDIALFDIDMASAALNLQLTTYTAYNSAATNRGALSVANAADMSSGIFLRARRNGSDYFWEFSFNGYGIQRLLAYNLAFTPAHIGLAVSNNATAVTLDGLFQFYRYTGSDVGCVPISGQRVRYYA